MKIDVKTYTHTHTCVIQHTASPGTTKINLDTSLCFILAKTAHSKSKIMATHTVSCKNTINQGKEIPQRR